MVPETDEPVLQLRGTLVERARHEHSRTQVHRVGMELVDEAVEMAEEIRDPVDQVLDKAVQRPAHTHTHTVEL